MNRPNHAVNQAVEEFRAYLVTLAFIQIDPRLRSRFGLSDVIQNTLLEAYRDLERIRVLDDAGRKRWLRRMLLNNLLERIEYEEAGQRDARREQSLDAAAAESASRLRDWITAEESTPSAKLIKEEERLRVLEALSQLPEREREALMLQQYHGWKLAQIAEHLGCTTNAVAGLQARGRASLRDLLGDLE
jgi:RNA polymerase sigma-70 factor (ECF subfamily)